MWRCAVFDDRLHHSLPFPVFESRCVCGWFPSGSFTAGFIFWKLLHADLYINKRRSSDG